MRNLRVILPSGREISSGDPLQPGIAAFRYTHRVNDADALDLGSACAAMVEMTVLSASDVTIESGDNLRCYQDDALLGQFLVDTVSFGGNRLQLTAFDAMTRFDVDLTAWLASLTGWPYTVNQLLSMVCGQCAVECAPEVELVNGNLPVPRFLGEVTGRQLIRWIAGANGKFATITPEGRLTFRFYREEALALPLATASLSPATKPIARVRLRQTGEDVGVLSSQGEGETYTVTGNPLVLGDPETAAGNLEAVLRGFSYSPGKVSFFDEAMLCRPGMILTVDGYKVAVFSLEWAGGISKVQSTGPASSEAAAALNKRPPLTVLQGKVLELKADVSGITAEAKSTALRLQQVETEAASLSLSADGIRSRVEDAEQQLLTKADGSQLETVRQDVTELKQTAKGLDVTVKSLSGAVEGKADKEVLTEVTEHFRFASDGMTISNTATGMGINVSEQQVAFIGGQDPTTIIRPNDMETTNLLVKTQLDLGGFSFIPRTNKNLSLRWTGGNT